MTAPVRKPALSWLNVLFCLLVVLIHTLSSSISSLEPTSWQYLLLLIPQRLAFVAVPGFFLLSGLKLFLHLPESVPRYYGKRVRTILVPYLIAVVVYYAYFVRLGWLSFSWRELGYYFLTGRVSSHLYFVVALVQFILLTPLWIRWVERYSAVVMLPLSIVVSWLSGRYLGAYLELVFPGLGFALNDRVFATYLCYFLAGCYIGKNYERFLVLLRKNRVPITAAFVVLALGDAVGSGLQFSGRAYFPGLEEIHLAYQGCAILFFFQIAAGVGELPRPLKRLDQVSYLVYLYHCLAISIFDCFGAFVSDEGLRLLIKLPFVYGTVIAGCILWRWCALRIKTIIKKGECHGST